MNIVHSQAAHSQAAYSLGALCMAAAVALPAQAQLLSHKDLSQAMALTIATTAADTCKANGYRVSVTIVGREGQIILQMHGDDASPHTMENSHRKAYTSRTFRIPSGELANRMKGDPALPFVHLTNVIAAQGALPIKIGDEVIGAVGVSGSPGGEKDEVCAKAGIDKVADQLK
ncbi:MAG TPA: heme-binding protein [Stellaceae bacterium]|jgi:uncharacterized protein GlcG (DUF336 family)|nr:heme-binding protein [Stellaceae bacterium]